MLSLTSCSKSATLSPTIKRHNLISHNLCGRYQKTLKDKMCLHDRSLPQIIPELNPKCKVISNRYRVLLYFVLQYFVFCQSQRLYYLRFKLEIFFGNICNTCIDIFDDLLSFKRTFQDNKFSTNMSSTRLLFAFLKIVYYSLVK